MARKKRHVAHRREIRFFRAIFLTSILSQTEGGDSIHRIFKRLHNKRKKPNNQQILFPHRIPSLIINSTDLRMPLPYHKQNHLSCDISPKHHSPNSAHAN